MDPALIHSGPHYFRGPSGIRVTRAYVLLHQDGKPYILACEAGEAGPDPRSKGWNIAAKSTFASKADMDYYDNECEAHRALKVLAKPVVEDVMTVWFENIFAQ